MGFIITDLVLICICLILNPEYLKLYKNFIFIIITFSQHYEDCVSLCIEIWAVFLPLFKFHHPPPAFVHLFICWNVCLKFPCIFFKENYIQHSFTSPIESDVKVGMGGSLI